MPGMKTEREVTSAVSEGMFKKKKSAVSERECVVFDKELFENLRKLRKEIAGRNHVPPYIVFSDVSLKEMAMRLPQDYDSFMEIDGVGEIKLKKYGNLFLEIITG